jgi:hypothetical protein
MPRPIDARGSYEAGGVVPRPAVDDVGIAVLSQKQTPGSQCFPGSISVASVLGQPGSCDPIDWGVGGWGVVGLGHWPAM